MRPIRWRFWSWMIWLGLFAGLEAWAIFDSRPGDTLSESVWFLQRSWWPLTVLLAVLFVFLIVHFIFDKRSRRQRAEELPDSNVSSDEAIQALTEWQQRNQSK